MPIMSASTQLLFDPEIQHSCAWLTLGILIKKMFMKNLRVSASKYKLARSTTAAVAFKTNLGQNKVYHYVCSNDQCFSFYSFPHSV